MHTVFALLCFVMVIHWLIFPYPSGLLHWHCGNLTIAPVPAKQPWWICINTSCEFIMNDCITTTKQSTTKPCAYFLGYTVSDKCKSLVAEAVTSIGLMTLCMIITGPMRLITLWDWIILYIANKSSTSYLQLCVSVNISPSVRGEIESWWKYLRSS